MDEFEKLQGDLQGLFTTYMEFRILEWLESQLNLTANLKNCPGFRISAEKALCFGRPAYMDECEKLQGDLQGLFTVYTGTFRNLEWLES
jgi:hypothetical protein